ncbi:putative uncharacterized protein [Clostridium sp. CAG:524]|nr:putative uncharacterized protein [Clostridium sp. CAG:524]
MKKILLILLVFISFIKVNALSIDKMYIDSEIDISGNLLVKEVIEINNLNEDFDYKLYFKDMNLTLNDKNYYDGINISIENIGLLNEDYDLNLLNKDDFKKYIKESNDIETIKNDNNYSVKIKKNNKKTYIYIDYMVLSLSVIHNDIAEFYYKYLNNLEYNIKELKIIFKLPYSSNTFDVYAHSNMKANITKDDKNYLVIIQKKDYKKDNDLDLRVLYDKDLYQVVYNKNKKSNIDALDLIKNIENDRISSTKRNNILPYVFTSIIVILIVFITIFIIKYKHIKK